MNTDLVIKDLRVSVADKEILKGVNLTVKPGSIHAIMGPNGSGKSTLAYTLMSHPGYTVTGGEVWYKGENMAELEIDESFVRRYLNEGFSGGEKKRVEILQMAMLKPQMAIMDETDSGLDIDALRIVSQGVNTLYSQQPEMGVMVITHYQRLLNY